MDQKKILLGILLSVFLVVVGQKNQNDRFNTIEDQQINETDKKFIKFYFQAEKNKLTEEYSEALVAYEKCISLIPEESSPYYQLSKLYFYIFQDLDNAKYYIDQAISLDPKNEWYYYELLSIYSIENNLEGQLNTHYKLIDINSNQLIHYLDVIKILTELKDHRTALRVIKKAEKKLGVRNELLLALKDIYLHQNNFREAEKIGKELIKRSPTFFNTLADIYIHFNDYENATLAYQRLLTIDPNNPKAIIALHAICLNKEDVFGQEKYLLKIAESDQINIEIKKEIFYNLLRNNTYSTYSSFKIIVEKAIYMHPKEPLFHLMLGDISTKERDLPNAIKHYYSALNSGVIKDEYIYTKLIEIYWQQEETDSIIEITKTAIERFPFTPMFYYYQGTALSSQGKYKLSIETLLKGKDFIFDNEPLVSDFYSLIGNSYHELNNNHLSDQAYENALEHNPNNTYVLNNYSYYLSGREEKLFLAKEMIIKCINLTSNNPNPSFLDTYAWVLYKLGEYDLAKIEIEKALSLEEGSAVIFDHYGDILYSLGLLDDAKIQWQKAHSLDKENLTIKKKLDIE